MLGTADFMAPEQGLDAPPGPGPFRSLQPRLHVLLPAHGRCPVQRREVRHGDEEIARSRRGVRGAGSGTPPRRARPHRHDPGAPARQESGIPLCLSRRGRRRPDSLYDTRRSPRSGATRQPATRHPPWVVCASNLHRPRLACARGCPTSRQTPAGTRGIPMAATSWVAGSRWIPVLFLVGVIWNLAEPCAWWSADRGQMRAAAAAHPSGLRRIG